MKKRDICWPSTVCSRPTAVRSKPGWLYVKITHMIKIPALREKAALASFPIWTLSGRTDLMTRCTHAWESEQQQHGGSGGSSSNKQHRL